MSSWRKRASGEGKNTFRSLESNVVSRVQEFARRAAMRGTYSRRTGRDRRLLLVSAGGCARHGLERSPGVDGLEIVRGSLARPG